MTTRQWTSREVRETFLSFFEKRGHKRVTSSPLWDPNDPTLLFTNAGMNQFKDVFLGREKRAYTRATSSQKCVRAGGKHNDLDNVGYTARHHTFFEMLGNFSFGDYFKEEAIDCAWELVRSKELYGLDPARLWATVYAEDDEAAKLWERYLPKERIRRFGEKDNFWSMGDTGPCGPCSEIHYDQGPGVPGDDHPNGAGDRVMEIWNLVFMQFDRDASGTMTPLPKPSVDTGAGLERITAILEGKNNNYDTDLFAPIIRRIEELSGKTYKGKMAVEDAPFRVIADHARAATMLIADGVMPGKTGRGYVLRRILRRAARYGRRLGIEHRFLGELVRPVFLSFEGVFFGPQDHMNPDEVSVVITEDETLFDKTMSTGADRVGEAISNLRRKGETWLSGDAVFRLYDTHGVPLEAIEEIASDEGVNVDRDGFEKELEKARERSKASSKFETDEINANFLLGADWHTEFLGYPEKSGFNLQNSRVKVLFDESGPIHEAIGVGREAWAVLDKTVFYPEGGGQVADIGRMTWNHGQASVLDAKWLLGYQFIAHRVRVERGSLEMGTHVDLAVDEWTRRKTQANHTGTHLLHAALRKVLGESVRQMGSLVAPDRLRFDYSASKPATSTEIAEIERLVNEEILRDVEVTKENMSMEAAKKRGAIMFFGEKYGDRVRVVDVPGFSTELCGGCHVNRTGEIGAFKILSDRGLAAGVRRIEAVTSLNAVDRLRQDEEILSQLSDVIQAPPEDLPAKVREALQRVKEQEKEIAKLKVQLAMGGNAAATKTFSDNDGVLDIAGIKVLARRVPSLPTNELRNLADTFRSKLKSGVVLLGTELEGKVTLLAAVTPDIVARVSAHDLAQTMAPIVGGKGGGKPDLAQAGGKDASQIDVALAAGVSRVREKLEASAG